MTSARYDTSPPTTSTSYTRTTLKGKEKAAPLERAGEQVVYRTYRNEEDDLEGIMRLVEQELSEP